MLCCACAKKYCMGVRTLCVPFKEILVHLKYGLHECALIHIIEELYTIIAINTICIVVSCVKTFADLGFKL